MKKTILASFLLVTTFLCSAPWASADGKDLTVSGKVKYALWDESAGKVYLLYGKNNKPLPDKVKIDAKLTVTGDRQNEKGQPIIWVEDVKES